MDVSASLLQETGRAIADDGFLITAAAAYIVYSSALIFIFMKWTMRIVNDIIVKQQELLEEVLSLQKQQHEMLTEMNSTLND
ncbi:MAG: hypothetical protein PHU68_00710 [Paludibacter sp.]|jgi:hypothetical protein|nr:hypothetical protein [Paludibacter sp.]